LLSDHRKTAEEKSRVIMQALYANSRLRIKRVSMLELRVGRRGPAKRSYEALYKSSLGGAVQIMMFPTGDEEETDGFASVQREYIEAISEVIRKYRYQVLTIFCLPAESRSGYKLLREYLDQMTFIEMAEASVSRERALAYLKTIAGKHGVRVNASLKKMLVQDDGYYAGDLIRIFDTWYDAKLKRELYPQYSEMEIYGKKGKTREAKGLAYDELMEMEGIDEAKKLIKMAVECRKAQKVFAAAGMGEERFSMHMVFTGNPGTAKTTVARLFARSLKENGLVDSGVFIEAGRGDLVGKYVGWTAKNIQGKFKEATGGVLFIDEAYSLLDGRSGSFGDEAINTIVQEMENHRESVIVIFAGYPDRMEEFLERNPGLRSRIAFHVPFPDYDAPQLTNSAGFTARKMGLNLSEDARDKLGGMFETARKNKNFGNGRYVRNVLEKARMKQMTRILEMGYEAVSSQEVNLIRACDIEVPETEAAETIRFGFCS
jgi:AAA+ superfamily predicted ATPase